MKPKQRELLHELSCTQKFYNPGLTSDPDPNLVGWSNKMC